MRLRSTGLGDTELFGELTEMKRSMSGVLMRVKIKKPVVWRVRVFLQPKDLRAIVWRGLMPWNIWFIIKKLITKTRNSEDSQTPSNNFNALRDGTK